MSLLREIQASVMQEAEIDVGRVLLKLRFLASRLGSDLLEEWIKHELDGYPEGIPVPNYRKMGVAYTGIFSEPYGGGLNNVPIPLALIKTYAGERWVTYEMRQGIAEIDDLIRSSKNDKGGTLQINVSDLILLLQGKIYERMACISITGLLSISEVVALQFSVRKRVLELTIKLENRIPAAGEITIVKPSIALSTETAEATTRIAHQTIYADNYTVISNSGTGTQSVSVLNICKGDIIAYEKALIEGGISEVDASELAKIVSKEEPQSREEPFGVQAKTWLAKNLDTAVKETWKVGKEIAMKLLTEATIQYYFK